MHGALYTVGCRLWVVDFGYVRHLLLRHVCRVGAEAGEQLRHQTIHALIASERTARAHTQLALWAVESAYAEPPEYIGLRPGYAGLQPGHTGLQPGSGLHWTAASAA